VVRGRGRRNGRSVAPGGRAGEAVARARARARRKGRSVAPGVRRAVVARARPRGRPGASCLVGLQ
jgi:hypothetical protein